MARSRRRTPIFGNAVAFSEKHDKRRANRCLRVRLRAFTGLDEGEYPPLLREVSSVWLFEKDGKHYWRRATAREMRK